MVNCQHYTNSKEGRSQRTNELSGNKLVIPSCQGSKQDDPEPVETRNRDNSAQKPEWIQTRKVNSQQILVLRRLIEGVKSRKLPAVLTFIDFKKAFDSVHRGKMLKILEAYGIPVKIVQLIRLM